MVVAKASNHSEDVSSTTSISGSLLITDRIYHDKTINDCIEGQLGPLVGVLSAMKWIKKNKFSYNWIATFPCDTPFFNTSIIVCEYFSI